MSGKVGGVQKRFLDIIKTYQTDGVDMRAPFVHYASHNLNLVINDAAEATIEGITFLVLFQKRSTSSGVVSIAGLCWLWRKTT